MSANSIPLLVDVKLLNPKRRTNKNFSEYIEAIKWFLGVAISGVAGRLAH